MTSLWVAHSLLLGGLNAEKEKTAKAEAQAKAIAKLYPKKA